MSASPPPSKLPPIYVDERDYGRLTTLAQTSDSLGAALLRKELDRAVLVKGGQAWPRFARMGSTVEFADLVSGRVQTVKLVEPADADPDEGRLSILAPTGAALLGLCTGDAFSWMNEERLPRIVSIRGVRDPSLAPAQGDEL